MTCSDTIIIYEFPQNLRVTRLYYLDETVLPYDSETVLPYETVLPHDNYETVFPYDSDKTYYFMTVTRL